jgi:hypothetical protein
MAEEDVPKRRPNGTMMPGHTPNPNGRPPKSRNLITLFNEKRDEKISIKQDGKATKMTRQEAWITNLWNKAVACDPKASAAILAIMRQSGQLDPVGDAEELSEDDAAILQALIGRLNDKGRGSE